MRAGCSLRSSRRSSPCLEKDEGQRRFGGRVLDGFGSVSLVFSSEIYFGPIVHWDWFWAWA